MNILVMKNLLRKLRKLLAALQELLRRKEKKKQGSDFERFALAIRKAESCNNYKIVNVYGYMGAYQFGMARLCDLGYTESLGYNHPAFSWKTGYSKEYFLNHPDFQDRVFREHVIDLVKQIKSQFAGYIGKTFNGIEITLSGLVAGAHLGGIGGVKNFLRGTHDNKDAFGTSVSGYIKRFKGYNLEDL